MCATVRVIETSDHAGCWDCSVWVCTRCAGSAYARAVDGEAEAASAIATLIPIAAFAIRLMMGSLPWRARLRDIGAPQRIARVQSSGCRAINRKRAQSEVRALRSVSIGSEPAQSLLFAIFCSDLGDCAIGHNIDLLRTYRPNRISPNTARSMSVRISPRIAATCTRRSINPNSLANRCWRFASKSCVHVQPAPSCAISKARRSAS